MPFQDDPTKRPLYDTLDGGPPQAWKCMLPAKYLDGSTVDEADYQQAAFHHICGKICASLIGIIMHQKIVHKFEPQQEMAIEKRESTPTGTTGTGKQISASEPPDA